MLDEILAKENAVPSCHIGRQDWSHDLEDGRALSQEMLERDVNRTNTMAWHQISKYQSESMLPPFPAKILGVPTLKKISPIACTAFRRLSGLSPHPPHTSMLRWVAPP